MKSAFLAIELLDPMIPTISTNRVPLIRRRRRYRLRHALYLLHPLPALIE
jgi:hypothetical protein